MKVAIAGSSGYIGSALADSLAARLEGCEVIRIGRRENVDISLDLNRTDEFDFNKLVGIDYVIFTAAISGPDKCANDIEECREVNVTGTGNFIAQALNRGCRVLFFSSDAVYAGGTEQIYDENSILEPRTPYGQMKKEIETRFQGQQGFKAVRLSYVISARDKFFSYLLGCRERHSEAELFHPYYRNVIMLDEVLQSVSWLLENWKNFEPQALCLAGAELVSRLRLADELNGLGGERIVYHLVIPDEVFFQNRPRVAQMRSCYLYEYGILPRKTFTERFQAQFRGRIDE